MATYLILDLIVLGLLVVAFFVLPERLALRRMLVVLGVMLALTAIFDSLIILNGVVAYDAGKILGVYIFKAPVEDFAYAIVVAILVPYLWHKLERKK